MADVDRVVDCPECHRLCHACSWYAKNARQVGCGLRVPQGLGYDRKPRAYCAWGEQLKGTTCGLCGGAGKVRIVGHYERLPEATT